MVIRSAVPSFFSAAVFSGAALSVASVRVEDEDGTVFAADLDRLAGVGALVEEVETRLRMAPHRRLGAVVHRENVVHIHCRDWIAGVSSRFLSAPPLFKLTHPAPQPRQA